MAPKHTMLLQAPIFLPAVLVVALVALFTMSGNVRAGLGGSRAFSPAPTRLTVLLHDQPSPLAHIRRDPRSIAATRPIRFSSGRLRPAFSLTWGSPAVPRHRSASAAPWRA